MVLLAYQLMRVHIAYTYWTDTYRGDATWKNEDEESEDEGTEYEGSEDEESEDEGRRKSFQQALQKFPRFMFSR